MASVTIKLTDGSSQTIGTSYFFGFNVGTVSGMITKLNTIISDVKKSRDRLNAMAMSAGTESVRSDYVDYVYISEYEEGLANRAAQLDDAIDKLTTARDNLRVLLAARNETVSSLSDYEKAMLAVPALIANGDKG